MQGDHGDHAETLATANDVIVMRKSFGVPIAGGGFQSRPFDGESIAVAAQFLDETNVFFEKLPMMTGGS